MDYIDQYGVRYSEDKSTLIQCPETFEGACVILEGTTTIEDCGFYDCAKLTSVTIPRSLKFIGEEAFQNCEQLAEIHYQGTMTEWEKIEKEYTNYDYANVVHCIDGDIKLW